MLAILLGYVFGFGGPLVVLLTVFQSESISVFEKVYPELLKRLDDSNDKIRVAVCEASTWFQQLWQLLLLQQALDVFFKCLPQNWSRTLYECPTVLTTRLRPHACSAETLQVHPPQSLRSPG